MEILAQKIEDKQFLNLIRNLLKVGYLEDWKFHSTYSGAPQGRLDQFCKEKRYGNYQKLKPKRRGQCHNASKVETILTYNAEIRGIANYFGLAYAVKTKLNKLYFLWKGSLLRTLASQSKKSVRQTAKNLRLDNGDYGIHYEVKVGIREMKLFRLKTWELPKQDNFEVDTQPRTNLLMGRTELIKRLNASKCEYCQHEEGPFEVHHVRGLKDIKEGKEEWQQQMIARNRKTLVM